jgi:hypothetical protein
VEIIDGSEQPAENITDLGGIVKDKNEYLLVINFPKNKYLPESELEHFSVDAFTWMELGNKTFIDYIHDLPGHPGSIAPDIAEDPTLTDGDKDKSDDSGVSSGVALAAVILIIIVIVVILLLVMKSKRKK